MAEIAAQALPAAGDGGSARLHTILRFAGGTTGAFVVSEAMGWYPTFLGPLLAGVLLANLPNSALAAIGRTEILGTPDLG